MKTVRETIHLIDPYDGLEPDYNSVDLQGWGGHPEFFYELVDWLDREPSRIVEVGTWKGRSAQAWATAVQKRWSTDTRSSSTEIVCVDTWLGASEFWTNVDDPKRYGSLRLKNGYPQVYYTFLNNMLCRGLRDVVTPFPQTSMNAARVMVKNGLLAKIVYIDGSHEFDDVRADLNAWWDVLDRVDGNAIFCGDDYCPYWRGVIQAVNEFASEHSLVLQTRRYFNRDAAPSDYWMLTREGIR